MTKTPSDRPLRVVQIVTTLARGGAQATVIGSSGATGNDLEVTVLAGRDRTDEGTYWGGEELDGIQTVVAPTLVRRLAPLDDLRALWWLTRWLRAQQPDVVHTHSSKAGVLGRIAAKAAGVPCAHTVHGWGPLASSSAAVRFAARAVEWTLAHLCDALVVVGTPDLAYGLDRRIGNPSQYRVIRSGIDTRLARTAGQGRSRVRDELDLGSRFVVGMVARLSAQKDHNTLLQAFAEANLADSTLVLIGDGPLRADIGHLAAELGIADRVLFLGVRPDAARLVAAFDVSVLSSRHEGMPRSVVEAAAAGVPVVATDVGSVSELIEHDVSGLLVGVAAVPELAAALTRLHRDPVLASALATAAVERVDEFSVERMREELAQLWNDLAGRTTDRIGRGSVPVAARGSARRGRTGPGSVVR